MMSFVGKETAMNRDMFRCFFSFIFSFLLVDRRTGSAAPLYRILRLWTADSSSPLPKLDSHVDVFPLPKVPSIVPAISSLPEDVIREKRERIQKELLDHIVAAPEGAAEEDDELRDGGSKRERSSGGDRNSGGKSATKKKRAKTAADEGASDANNKEGNNADNNNKDNNNANVDAGVASLRSELTAYWKTVRTRHLEHIAQIEALSTERLSALETQTSVKLLKNPPQQQQQQQGDGEKKQDQ